MYRRYNIVLTKSYVHNTLRITITAIHTLYKYLVHAQYTHLDLLIYTENLERVPQIILV